MSSNSDRCATMAYVPTGNPLVLKHILLESLTWNSSPGLLHRYHPGISFPSDPRNSFWLYFGNLVFSESQVFLFVYSLLVEHFLRKGTWKVNFLRLFTSESLYFFTPDYNFGWVKFSRLEIILSRNFEGTAVLCLASNRPPIR